MSYGAHMTKSILLVALLAVPLGGCGWFFRPEAAQPPGPPSATELESLKSAFGPYCGPIWSVGKQGYVNIPCPPGSNYPGANRL
jgi:hypothetical protein